MAAVLGLQLACGGTGTGQSVARSDVAVSCGGEVVRPGKPVRTGDKICGAVTVGAKIVVADFAGNPSPVELVEVYAGHKTTDFHEAATFDSGAATLHSSGSSQEAIIYPQAWLQGGAPPADIIVVVDLIGLSENSTIGVAPRCADEACVLVSVNADGKYRFADRQNSSWKYPLVGNLNGEPNAPEAMHFFPGRENRLIVWMSHETLAATINGRELGTLKVTDSPAAKQAFLFHTSLSKDKPSTVAIRRLYIFEAVH